MQDGFSGYLLSRQSHSTPVRVDIDDTTLRDGEQTARGLRQR